MVHQMDSTCRSAQNFFSMTWKEHKLNMQKCLEDGGMCDRIVADRTTSWTLDFVHCLARFGLSIMSVFIGTKGGTFGMALRHTAQRLDGLRKMLRFDFITEKVNSELL